MIVNTVPPVEQPSPEHLAENVAEPLRDLEQAPTPDRVDYSAKVDLKFIIDGTGEIIPLAQTGQDFVILSSKRQRNVTAGERGELWVVIDGTCEPIKIELTSDTDFATDRVTYKRIEAELTTEEQTTTPIVTDTTPVVLDRTEAIAALDTAIAKAEQERLFWEEVRLLGELRENEEQRNKLDTELAAAKERQCELQTELNNLSMRIPRIQEDVEECCEDTLTLARALWRLKAPSAATVGQAASLPEPERTPAIENQPAAEESTEWRNLATAELLAGIKGLGKKKLETICELAPTVGHLEDLREQASREHKQYNEVLPDGCGAGVAQMIEDRLVAHIANMAKRSTGGNALADELLQAFRQKVASESWQAKDCPPDANDTEQTHLGFAAFNEGKPHSALPTQNPELARQWMLGWVCAEVIKHSSPSPNAATELIAEATSQVVNEVADAVKPPEKKPRKPRKAKATS